MAEILTHDAFLCQKRGGSQIPILEGETKSLSHLAERIPACLPNNIGRRPSPRRLFKSRKEAKIRGRNESCELNWLCPSVHPNLCDYTLCQADPSGRSVGRSESSKVVVGNIALTTVPFSSRIHFMFSRNDFWHRGLLPRQFYSCLFCSYTQFGL